jgi:hypothetical protein
LRRAAAGIIPAFLVVESAESIRDSRSGDAAEAMIDFMRIGAGFLDPGIAVCMCEGVEDGLYETRNGEERDLAVQRLRDACFMRANDAWVASSIPKSTHDIRVFWRDALDAMKHNDLRRDQVAHWSNCRLEIRRRPLATAA